MYGRGAAACAIWLTITTINQFQAPRHNLSEMLKMFLFSCFQIVASVALAFMTSNEKLHPGERAEFQPTAGILHGINNDALIDWSSVISGHPPLSPGSPICKWVTFRRAPSGSSGRWAVTVMGCRLAWINITGSGTYLGSSATWHQKKKDWTSTNYNRLQYTGQRHVLSIRF